jgi:hypothetical protein
VTTIQGKVPVKIFWMLKKSPLWTGSCYDRFRFCLETGQNLIWRSCEDPNKNKRNVSSTLLSSDQVNRTIFSVTMLSKIEILVQSRDYTLLAKFIRFLGKKKGHSLLYLDHIRQDLMLKQQRFSLGSYRSYRIKKDHVIIYERLIRRTPQLSSPSFSSHLSSHFAKLYISLLNWKIILFY